MSFLVVGNAEEKPGEEPQALTWAQRIANRPSAPSQQQRTTRPQRGPVQHVLSQKQKMKVKVEEEEDAVDGFGMFDIVDTRRHWKGNRR
eukprot:4735204-Amphidinium_carterae.1